MGSIRVNTRCRGVVLCSFEGVPSAEQFDAYLRVMDSLLAQRQRSVVICDATRGQDTGARNRDRQAHWNKDNRVELKQYTVGVAFVYPSPLFRFVISMMVLIQPLPFPYVVCRTLDEALAWAEGRLRREGMPVPDLRELHGGAEGQGLWAS